MSEEQAATAGSAAVRPDLVLGRAARALVAGEYAQAVGLHRQLETKRGLMPRFEPARVAARGFLAARAGDWAASVEWYRLAVGFQSQWMLHPPADWRCRLRGCGRELGQERMLRCGQCHRPCCPDHGTARPNRLERCADCLWTALSNLAAAAIALESPQLALPAITSWADQGGSTEAQLLRDLLDGDRGARPRSRDLGRLVLLRQAATAPDSLREMVAGTALADELPVLAAQQAGRRGDPAAAEEAWRRAWAASPNDVTLVHAAGLAALAAALAEPDPLRCAAAARRAVGCLAMTLNGGAYWRALAEATGRPLTEAEREETGAAFEEHLRLRLRELDARLAAPPHHGLELAWAVECEAVRLLMQLATGATGEPAPTAWGSTLLGGPIFLTLGQPPGAEQTGLAATVALLRERLRWPDGREPQRTHSTEFLRLVEVASPDGPFWQLLAEQRFQEAIDVAELEIEATPNSRAGIRRAVQLDHLLGQALLGRAKERLESHDWKGAFFDYDRAEEVGAELLPHQDDFEKAVYQYGKELRRADRSSWKDYADLLHIALRLLPSPGLASNLEEALERVPDDYRQPGPPNPDREFFRRRRPKPAPTATGVPRTEPPSPYLVLNLPASADGSALQAAYLRELKAAGRDAARKKQVAAARSALSTPQRRRLADLLVPLPGLGVDANELMADVGQLTDEQAATLLPVKPTLAQLIPLVP